MNVPFIFNEVAADFQSVIRVAERKTLLVVNAG
jgi:hypothetical protein